MKPTETRVDLILPVSELQPVRGAVIYAAMAGALRLPGDVAECGVAAGGTAVGLRALIEMVSPKKRLHLFDTFKQTPLYTDARNELAARAVESYSTLVTNVIARVGQEGVDYHAGLFSETMPDFDKSLCFVHADSDLYESTLSIMEMVSRCVIPGGVVVWDDYGSEWTGVTSALDKALKHAQWWAFKVEGLTQLVTVRR